jgi:hypothetical protein
MEAALTPLPTEETTPPVQKTYFVILGHPGGEEGSGASVPPVTIVAKVGEIV